MNKYEELVKVVANSNRSEKERGEILVREIAQLIDKILNYNYTVEHYDGDGTAISDRRNEVKNAIALVKSDLDVYTEQLGLTEVVDKKVADRLEAISKRI